ncbi:daptide-type RiPP biosynthesis aminotransferase [Nocardioides lijunqiniae]|uniref:daptide-type RiPP biosynthesis aminotransferase n=1 Tax=Nocardioides lijunqiniae TaxID=2760832 RepID=UPI0018778DC6|nr:daptide-type RiPP biosynthesis aminotransferase [Nocardioides lijunqiniae]
MSTPRRDAAGPSALWASLLPPSAHGREDTCFESAHGVRVTTSEGRNLLCGTSGLWNVNLGYGNEAIAEAAYQALRDASYLSVFRYENSYAREAADRLVSFAGAEHYDRVLFSTSGGAANDLVMKLVRQYHALRGESGRRLVVGLRQGYHGLTFGSFALTDDDLGQAVYGVDRSQVRHLSTNDVDQLHHFMDRHGARVAAVVVEPLQGTGATVLDDEYVAALGELSERHGYLVVADEVATGFGRLGHAFASQTWARQPDLLVTSKGLTNGTLAASAVLTAAHVSEAFSAVDALVGHAETQAGTAVTCAVVVATLDEMARLDAVQQARRLSAELDVELARLVDTRDDVLATTGAGCFRSLRLATPDGTPLPQDQVPQVVERIRAAGAIVHPGPQGIQLVPALTYTRAELDELLGCVQEGLAHHREPVGAGA